MMEDKSTRNGANSAAHPANPEADKRIPAAKRASQKVDPQKRKAPEKPSEDTAEAYDGVVLTTSEILDFSNGADS